ncbi:hypothetical protein ABTI13_19235, partial [Acinetobacter baumannii]
YKIAFVGAHLPHVSKIQAAREFYSRHKAPRTDEAVRICEEWKGKKHNDLFGNRSRIFEGSQVGDSSNVGTRNGKTSSLES